MILYNENLTMSLSNMSAFVGFLSFFNFLSWAIEELRADNENSFPVESNHPIHEFRCSFVINTLLCRTKLTFQHSTPLSVQLQQIQYIRNLHYITTWFAYLKMGFRFFIICLAICFLYTDGAIHRLQSFFVIANPCWFCECPWHLWRGQFLVEEIEAWL